MALIMVVTGHMTSGGQKTALHFLCFILYADIKVQNIVLLFLVINNSPARVIIKIHIVAFPIMLPPDLIVAERVIQKIAVRLPFSKLTTMK